MSEPQDIPPLYEFKVTPIAMAHTYRMFRELEAARLEIERITGINELLRV